MKNFFVFNTLGTKNINRSRVTKITFGRPYCYANVNRFQSVAVPVKVNMWLDPWLAVPFTMFPFSNVARKLIPNSSSNVQVLLPLSISPLTETTWPVSPVTLPEKKVTGYWKTTIKGNFCLTIVLKLRNEISVTSFFFGRRLLSFHGILVSVR